LFENDETRSAKLVNENAEFAFAVYDNPDFKREDDFTTVAAKKDIDELIIKSFESKFPIADNVLLERFRFIDSFANGQRYNKLAILTFEGWLVIRIDGLEFPFLYPLVLGDGNNALAHTEARTNQQQQSLHDAENFHWECVLSKNMSEVDGCLLYPISKIVIIT